MNAEQRSRISLAVTIAVAAVGTWRQFQDTPLLAMTIAAFGLLWAGRSRGLRTS